MREQVEVFEGGGRTLEGGWSRKYCVGRFLDCCNDGRG